MTPRTVIEPARLAGSSLLRLQSDARLIDLTRAGNQRAFEAIVERYRGPLLRYCSGILPAARAEDAVQQAFMNAYRAMVDGDAHIELRPWLYRIAHNASLNALRQSGWGHEELSEDFDGVERPDQAVERRERLGAVVASVQGLPERQRDAIVLRELEGRSHDEIARELGVGSGAVRQLLNRARNTLRAAATAVTPLPLVERLARAREGEPLGTRVAELTAGATAAAGTGIVATVAKVAATVALTGAVIGGAAQIPIAGDGDDRGRATVAAARGGGSDGDEDDGSAGWTRQGTGAPRAGKSPDDADRSGSGERSGRFGECDDDDDGRADADDPDDDDDRSGSSEGSGSGDSGDGDGDSSGSGSGRSGGGGDSGSDDSGDGDNSGSGSSGSGGSGSGDSGSSGTSGGSGSGSGTSGSSGSGSDLDGD